MATHLSHLRPCLWGLATAFVVCTIWAALGAADTAKAQNISPAKRQEYIQRLNLSDPQTTQVKAVSLNLRQTSDSILQKYGVRRGTCTNVGLLQLSSMNNEINGAFGVARGRLSTVLSPQQLQVYRAIFNEIRDSEKNAILCGGFEGASSRSERGSKKKSKGWTQK